jgi:hypothetical protein
MHEPLKNCPFCGGINIIHCGHHMYCHACGADGPDADSQHESEARSAWNRRTPQPVVREPLTDAQIAEMMRDTWGCASIAPRHALEFARAVERAHGIGSDDAR